MAASGRGAPPASGGIVAAAGCFLVVALVLVFSMLPAGSGRQIAGSANPAPAAPAGLTVESATSRAAPVPGPVYELGTNPLLTGAGTLGDVTCELPSLDRTADGLAAFHWAALACLDDAWRPAISSVNAPFQSTVLDFSPEPTGGCVRPSEELATGFYCDTDQTIYLPRPRLLAHLGVDRAAHLALLAHEYGHHVQSLSGILGAFGDAEIDRPADGDADEAGRRLELQANCFAGLFLASVAGRGSVAQVHAKAAVGVFRETTADATHGSHENQLAWARAGFDSGSTGACNTWVAPAEQVR